MALRIPVVLEAILEATALEAAAKARITALRKVLDEEARRRYAEDGAAPTWKARDAGTVRFDAPGDWTATVADPAAFGSYLAERHPEEVLGVIYVTAPDLADAIQALEFIGVKPVETRTEVRQPFGGKYLEGLVVDVEEDAHDDGTVDRTITVVDPDTGQLVDGVTATRTNGAGKLVVTLDKVRKARALEAAAADAAHVLAEATGGEALRTEVAQVPADDDALAVDHQRPEELGSAEGRVVTLEEAVTAGIVRPASELPPMHRHPYVGEGADGARRSAQIDREEADGYDPGEQRDACLASAEAWDRQAAELERVDGPAVAPPAVVDRDAAIDAVDAARNREELRRFARAKGINPGGTKGELIVRILDAGVPLEEVTG